MAKILRKRQANLARRRLDHSNNCKNSSAFKVPGSMVK